MGWAEKMDEVIRHYADKIHYVHFQSSNGRVPEFSENFVDEADYNPFRVVQALADIGFSGVMIPGHVPQLDGDTEWRGSYSVSKPRYVHPMGGHQARAYTIGFIKGLIAALGSKQG